ncbi:helix-turn-helix domain-containing protein [Carboxylicivirga sediminis]|nr:helix-turn-helix domain-containing protein [Carboxylicivirga sediminis]
MNFKIIHPSRQLAGIVKHYWLMEFSYEAKTVHNQRIVPTGLPELTFILGNKITSQSVSGYFNSHTLISGQQNSFYDIQASGKLKLLAVTLFPSGFAQICKHPASELFNQTICARQIWGQSISEVCEQLYESNNLQQQILLIEHFLIKQMAEQKPCYKTERVRHIIPHIDPAKKMSIQSMAEQSCWSRKNFDRSFKSLVGCSPKQFTNIIRFQYALHLKSKQPHLSLFDVAFQSGYYDQAHMNNDFIKLAGLTPRQLFSSCPPHSDYFGF